uniref:peroxisomal succinyl-coenzyme A thioesterase-like isoform X5 n=1 Tax=Scatophagus argus TaxID=75038 RepID=UPI001ED7FF93|nr:peroxisomal succinyl-coenzyme A thioesterase-like isoform X5 [Scatophagus argus]
MDMKKRSVTLSVQPSRGLMDEKFTILVQNVPSGFHLTIHGLHHCEEGNTWEAFAHYTANATGTVNVSEDPSLGGTYSGVEQMGLLWSLRPVQGSKPWLRLRKTNVQTPMEFTVSVYHGHQTEGFADQVPLAAVVVERWYMAPGVHRIPITEDGLDATLFLPPGRARNVSCGWSSGPGPFPGLLDLWGGGGRLEEYRAALLASHGFASLALDYLTPKITAETEKMVDNNYFEVAYRVLEQHPQVFSSRIAMLGLSLGATITFKMAAYSQVVKIKEMMEQAGNSYLLTLLSYPNAGHLIEPPYTPHIRTSIFKSMNKEKDFVALWGGEVVAHSRAQEDAWTKTLAFLRENLLADRNPAAASSSYL